MQEKHKQEHRSEEVSTKPVASRLAMYFTHVQAKPNSASAYKLHV